MSVKHNSTASRFIRPLSVVLKGSGSVFRERGYQVVAALGAFTFFGLYLLVPVWLVPGNTLSFELGLIAPLNYVLLAALALMTGVLLALELFSFRRSRAQGLRVAGEGGTGLIASLAGGVLAAASCGCGTGLLLGALGLGGGAFFVAANQTPIVIILLGVVIVGLYFSARRAAGLCVACRMPA